MASDDETLKRGDFIRIRAERESEWTPAMVTLASENGRSVFIMFSGALRDGEGGAHIGMAPLSVDYERETVEDLMGNRYEVERQERRSA